MNSKFSKQRFHLAQKRVEQIKSFYMHLAAYCTVNTILFIVWTFESFMPDTFWPTTFLITTLIAGFIVLAHAIVVFGAKYVLPKDWEEKKIKELMKKDNQQTKYE